MAAEAEVVVSPYGKRYHRMPDRDTTRAKDAACGGFVQTNLSRVPVHDARESDYSPCKICWQCRIPGCTERQEFPRGPSEFCLDHAHGLYFYWRPLAEFSLGQEADD